MAKATTKKAETTKSTPKVVEVDPQTADRQARWERRQAGMVRKPMPGVK